MHQAFKDLDKRAALMAIASEIWHDAVETERAVTEPERLLRFLLLTFADLKRSTFLYWLAIPQLGNQELFSQISRPAPASSVLKTSIEAASVMEGLARLWVRSVEGTGRPGCPPFFVISRGSSGEESGDVRVMSLLEFETDRGGADGVGVGHGKGHAGELTTIFGFVDPCSEVGGTPGWPLRNFLALLSARWGVKRARVLCYREFVPRGATAALSENGERGVKRREV